MLYHPAVDFGFVIATFDRARYVRQFFAFVLQMPLYRPETFVLPVASLTLVIPLHRNLISSDAFLLSPATFVFQMSSEGTWRLVRLGTPRATELQQIWKNSALLKLQRKWSKRGHSKVENSNKTSEHIQVYLRRVHLVVKSAFVSGVAMVYVATHARFVFSEHVAQGTFQSRWFPALIFEMPR